MLAEAIYFLLLWIPIMAISHEFCHALECKRQGGNPKIKIWWNHKIPSMCCSCDIETDNKFYFAGGIYNAIFTLGLAGLFSFISQPLSDVLLIYTTIQLSYGVYEGTCISKLPREEYMKYKNLVYVFGFITGLILTYLKRRK